MRPVDLKKAYSNSSPVIQVTSRQRIADAFGLDPAAMSRSFKAALGKGATAWDAYATLLATFERYLLSDARLLASYSKLRRRVAMLPFSVTPSAKDGRGAEFSEAYEGMLWDIERLIRNVLYELTDAIGSGFAAVELEGEIQNGKLAITGARGVEQWALRPTAAGGWEHKSDTLWNPVPDGKLLVWSLENKGSFITGGVMWPCLWLAMFKNYSFRDWVAFLEVYGQPLRVGWHEPSASEEDIEKLAQAVINITTDAGVVLPKGMEIDFKGALTGNANAYERLCIRIDSYIDEVILGGTLTMESGDKGARSLGEVHGEQLDDIVKFFGKDLAQAIDAGLGRPWLIYNYGERPGYPKLTFQFKKISDQIRRWQIDRDAIDRGVRIPERYFYDTYDWPEPQGDEPVVARPVGNQPNPALYAHAFDHTLRTGVTICSANEDEALGNDTELDRMVNAFAPRAVEHAALYGALIDGLETGADNAVSIPREVSRVFRQAFADRLAPLLMAANLAGLADVLDDAREERVTLDVAQVAGEMAAALRSGATVANAFEMPTIAAAIDLTDAPQYISDWTKITPQRALEFWSRFVSVPASQLAEFEPTARAYAFSIAGMEEQTVLDAAREGIRAALAEGTTVRDFKRVIDAACQKAGVSPLAPWHLQTVWRQNMLTAYGAGRVAAQNAPGVAALLPWKEYLVADGRARPGHLALNGMTKPVNDPIWQRYEPPWQYGCRCRTASRVRPRAGSVTEPSLLPTPDPKFDGGPLQFWKAQVAAGEA